LISLVVNHLLKAVEVAVKVSTYYI